MRIELQRLGIWAVLSLVLPATTASVSLPGCAADSDAEQAMDRDANRAVDDDASLTDGDANHVAMCDAIAILGLMVVVTDGADGPRICDASVTATAQGTETHHLLDGSSYNGGCVYTDFGHLIVSGVWDLNVTTPSGASGAVSGVTATLTEGGCFPLTVDVTIPVE